MKVYIKYDEGVAEMEIKLKLPKKWITGTLMPMKETFIDAYNKKHEEGKLTCEGIHFVNRKGVALADEEIVEKVFEDGEHVRLVDGNPPVYVEEHKEVSEVITGGLRCRNYGCQKLFNEEDNNDEACLHHCGPPIFHDTRKGWSCCKDIMVYDWDEFQAIPACSKGRHSTIDPKVAIAASPNAPSISQATVPPPPMVKSIDDFNSSNPQAVTAVSAVTSKPKEIEKRTDGMAKCVNKGCQQLYKVDSNSPSSCVYHPGNPVFHDAKKYWSCCEEKRKVAYDFDEFLQIEGCAIGPHADGN